MAEKVIAYAEGANVLLVFPADPGSTAERDACTCWSAADGHSTTTRAYAEALLPADETDAAAALDAYAKLPDAPALELGTTWTDADDALRLTRWRSATR